MMPQGILDLSLTKDKRDSMAGSEARVVGLLLTKFIQVGEQEDTAIAVLHR